MTPEMLERALRAFAHRRPFRPFWMEFFSGDRVLVSHPEATERFGGLFLYRGADRVHRLFAAQAVCQLVEHLAQTPSV